MVEKSLAQKIDSTKLSTWFECPRKYFIQYVLGWQPKVKSYHLGAGSAIHAGLELLMLCRKRKKLSNATRRFRSVIERIRTGQVWEEIPAQYGKLPVKYGYTPEVAAYAGQLVIDACLEEVDPQLIASMGNKDPDSLSQAMVEYAAHYAVDHFETLYTEAYFDIPLDAAGKFRFCGNIDGVIERDGEFWVMEHKTGSRLSDQWRRSWVLKPQVNSYTAALLLSGLPNVAGTIINGIFFYKGRRGFERVYIRRSERQIYAWIKETKAVLTQLHYAVQYAMDNMESLEKELTLELFPKNPQSCGNYFGCPYFDICRSCDNPLELDTIPSEYVERHWDPETKKQKAKVVLEVPNASSV